MDQHPSASKVHCNHHIYYYFNMGISLVRHHNDVKGTDNYNLVVYILQLQNYTNLDLMVELGNSSDHTTKVSNLHHFDNYYKINTNYAYLSIF